MTNLLARILLSILMLPLAVMCFIVIFAAVAGNAQREETGLIVATFATAPIVAMYWFMLWRRSVLWSPGRIGRTIAGSIGCIVAGVCAGSFMMSLVGVRDETFGIFFGGVFATVLWLPVTVLLWKETAAERTDRIRNSAGDVVFCPRCGYNLTGLYEPRCPECGARFTLNQLYAGQQREALADGAATDAPGE